jgi:hypothetical protein
MTAKTTMIRNAFTGSPRDREDVGHLALAGGGGDGRDALDHARRVRAW